MDSKPEVHRLVEHVESHAQRPLPPVERWTPALCGEIDIRIRADGQWLYQGEPMVRPQVARLFSTILKREEDDAYYLVTPVEKWRIQVEDLPFVVSRLSVESGPEGQELVLMTNMDEVIRLSEKHPLVLADDKGDGQIRPRVLVRRNLWARVERNAFYHLAELADADGSGRTGIRSAGVFFPLD